MKPFLLLLALNFAFLSLQAQWNADTEVNTTVSTAATADIQSVGTSDGKTYVAFWHDVPAPQYYEMRLQLLDQNGNLLFGEAGIVVNNTVPMSSFTTLWSIEVDNQNNVYIGFNGTDGGNPVFFHKISEDGTQLWGNSGINPGSGFDPKMLPLANGSVILCWLPGNKGVMQKFAADGTEIWADPVTIEPSVANHRTSAGELAELSNGRVSVILHDRGGFSPSSLPFVQQYDSTGIAVWPGPVALTTTFFTVFNRRYNLRQDSDTLYFGYAGAQGIQPHGFLQRIDPDGTLPWGINGSDFSIQASDYEQDVKIDFSPGSNFVWAICQYSNSAQSQVGVYVQKFDKSTGSRLLSDDAKVVFPVSEDYIAPQGNLQLVNDQPVFLVSDGNSNGVFPKDILAVSLDEAGEFVWPDQTMRVATNTEGVKSRVQLNTPYNGKVVAAWAEDRPIALESRAYAQQFDAGMDCPLPVAGFTYVVSDSMVTFTSTAGEVDFISWEFGDGFTFGGNQQATHTYQMEGVYNVCQIVINECGRDTICQEVNVLTSGISSPEALYGLKLSPNPGHGAFALTLDLPQAQELTYRLVDVNGKMIAARTVLLPDGQQTIPLELNTPVAGTYVLLIEVNGKKSALPLMVR